ncbi:unnamed protein product [Caretta caretta]
MKSFFKKSSGHWWQDSFLEQQCFGACGSSSNHPLSQVLVGCHRITLYRCFTPILALAGRKRVGRKSIFFSKEEVTSSISNSSLPHLFLLWQLKRS